MKTKGPDNIVTRVDAVELCRIFNEGQYVEKAARGELQMIVKKSRDAQMTFIRNWVPGTQSQEVHFLDADNNLVAKAHRFLRPDGTLAASGMVDPKRVFSDGKWYGLVSPDPDA
jgi:hypothetical protein